MLKNKNALLFTFILCSSSFVQADWRDTLRWLQSNTKKHATTKKVAAVVGVAALCAVGIGCWWKLRQPVKQDEAIRYAFHRKLLREGEYAEYQMSEDNAQGYKLFSLYYTDQDKEALDYLLNQDITKTRYIMDDFFDYSQQASVKKGDYFKELFKKMSNIAMGYDPTSVKKGDYFKELFQRMSNIARGYDPKARISAGMVFIDSKNNTLYAANIGNIAISNTEEYHQDVTDKYLGQELSLSDVQVKVLTLYGEIVIEKQSTKQIAAFPFEVITLVGSDDEMINIVASKDVALAVKWWK